MTTLELNLQACFGIIAPGELKTISALFEPETIKKNDIFLEKGNHCDKLSFVESGYLRVFVETDKKEITQWISGKGYFITDLPGFMFGQPSRWTIQALTDTWMYTIRKSDYQQIGNSFPGWPEFEKMFIVRCFSTMEERIFTHLSMTTEERYAFFFENNKELFNQVPLQYIASMLGMTPETLSRIRKKPG